MTSLCYVFFPIKPTSVLSTVPLSISRLLDNLQQHETVEEQYVARPSAAARKGMFLCELRFEGKLWQR